MTLHNNVRHIVRPSEDPNHPQYGPCRRLGVMLMQLFADKAGGLAGLEKRLIAFQQEALENVPPPWDEHLTALIRQGQSESSAQRIVMQQMLFAHQWIS